MDPLITSALISGAVSLLGSLFNIGSQKKQNEITREREDTAVQRYVKDSLQAGYSPLAGINQAKSQTMTAPTIQNNPINDMLNAVTSLTSAKSAIANAQYNAERAKSQALQNSADAEYLLKERGLSYNRSSYDYDLSKTFGIRTTDAYNPTNALASKAEALVDKLSNRLFPTDSNGDSHGYIGKYGIKFFSSPEERQAWYDWKNHTPTGNGGQAW